jgi:predicted ester cyclase
VEIEDLVADGDQIVAWIRMTGARGPGQIGGASADFRHAHRFRLRDGRIVEHWAIRDDLRAMIQGGIISPPGRPPG